MNSFNNYLKSFFFVRLKIVVCLIILGLSPNLNAQDQEIFQKKVFVKGKDTLLYRILYPVNFSKEKTYPVLLFLHGAGERGNDNASQLTHGSALFTNPNNRILFPVIVLFPQCSLDNYWSNVEIDRSTKPISFKFQSDEAPTKSLGLVIELMDYLLQKPFVNRQQVYVMGLSMGGMGTFEILAKRPTVFAAAIPICGGGNPSTATLYAKNTALWVFHGSKDDVVNPQFSVEMVKGILDAGGNPNFTLFGDANHNSWDHAFAEQNLLGWLFSKKRKE
ncbi:prolyl oligopeptidase family serine peptidase [Lutibacter sp.]|uniref:carboxylesterase family protein n=1 Tax=Lutibacter sp. TaxID=1925666 RepID=UPI002732B52A|nr:prolyl oligopeptidase family serine peptidase [Lutibacter sp.]MDP3314109.1 prolyl oligopeptidase family serine peptidase [Lutibacter sp.]